MADVPEPILRASDLDSLLHSPDDLSLISADGTVLWVSESGAASLGYVPDEMVGRSSYDYLHPDDVEMSTMGIMVGLIHPERLLPVALRYRHRSGDYGLFETRGGVRQYDDGSGSPQPAILVSSRDVALRQAFEHVLRSVAGGQPMLETFASIVRLASRDSLGWSAGLVVADLVRPGSVAGSGSGVGPGGASGGAADGVLQTVPGTLPPALLDPAAFGSTAPPWEEAVASGEDVTMTSLAGYPDAVREAAAASGFEAVVAVPVPDPGSSRPAVLVVWCDLALSVKALTSWVHTQVQPLLRIALDQRWGRAQLEWAARYDSLTGLANRARLFDTLGRTLGRCRDGDQVGVLYIDLDGFKAVNDTLGHAAGDHVLVEAAARFLAAVRPGDEVARLGGDEFAVVIPDCDGAEHAGAVGGRLVDAMAAPFVLPSGDQVHVGASVGAVVAGAGDSADGALRRADLAVYRAKHGGRGMVVVQTDPA
jgi:diguanylate cyclase (GGDEF)-like protein